MTDDNTLLYRILPEQISFIKKKTIKWYIMRKTFTKAIKKKLVCIMLTSEQRKV